MSCTTDKGAPTKSTSSPSSAGSLPSSHLIAGATIVTMNKTMDVIENGAIAVEDGVMTYVGSLAALPLSYKSLPRFDASGQLVIPGLINAHTHVPMVLFRGLADDLPLMKWLQDYIFPAEARNVTEDFVRWGTKLAMAEMISGGTTTFADMYYFESAIAEETAMAGMRAVLGQTVLDAPMPDHKTWDSALRDVREFTKRFKGHRLITPAIAPHAPYTVSKAHLLETHALARELGIPVLIHVSETKAENEGTLKVHGAPAVTYLNNLGFLDENVLAAHVVWPTPDEIKILHSKKVGIAHCPQSNMKLGSGVAPVPAMLKAGIPVGLGTDGAASNNDLDLWAEMDSAAKLQKIHHLDPTLISASEAFRMATIDGARALKLDHLVGSLETGKRADLAIVSLDEAHAMPSFNVYSHLVYALKAADVSSVMVDGRFLMKDRAFTTLDLGAIREKTAAYRKSIVASLEESAP